MTSIIGMLTYLIKETIRFYPANIFTPIEVVDEKSM
jgi:hypothetical protein